MYGYSGSCCCRAPIVPIAAPVVGTGVGVGIIAIAILILIALGVIFQKYAVYLMGLLAQGPHFHFQKPFEGSPKGFSHYMRLV